MLASPRLSLLAPLAVVVTMLVATPSAHAVYTTRTNVDTSPTGAEVYLVEAGGDKLLGITPLKLVRLPRGTIKLKMKKEGYDELVETVTIGRTVQSYVFNLIRTIQPATLEFISGPEFTGAKVEVDGRPEGDVPVSVRIPPGRHHAVVRKEGYKEWERWIDAHENERFSIDVVMQKLEAAPGEILVTSNPSGGEVRVNGGPKGRTPMVVEGLPAGPYLVEIVLDGYQTFSQSVNVESAKRTVVDGALVATKGVAGEVKILANIANASISFDGDPVGVAPVTLSDVKPGTHLIEARGPDGAVTSKNVDVRAGETSVVRLELTAAPVSPTKARVRVLANVAGAQVDIDGVRKGASPFAVDDLDPGTHFVTVTAPGYAPWQQTVTLAAGDNPEVIAQLGQAGRIEVRTKKGEAADVFVDGKPIGQAPFIGELAVGTHDVVVRRADGRTEEFKVAVATDRIVKITAAFGAKDPNAVPANTRPMPFSARAMPAGRGSIDAYVGWPYVIGFQAGGGIGSNMDLGVHFRSSFFVVINELEVRYQWTYAATRTVAASLEAGIGGGLGGEGRNSFFARALAKGSVMVGDKAAISARLGLLGYTDSLANDRSDSGAELTLGFSVEFRINKELNAFLIFDGNPTGGERKLYSEAGFPDDTKMYGSLGISYMF
ncbi:MAG: PEGA domain-containing protein [Deltaproteobacteria bacterium]|nr:MAG: PEGA domain-containing protein [Deltaproteobacteria bacterium]